MYDLTNFRPDDVKKCGETLARFGEGASTLEEVANRIVRHLHDNFIDPQTKRKACALVRLYKTHAYGELDAGLRGFAQGVLGNTPDSPDMRCLTLLATAGDKPEWNSRANSAGHKAIPLPSEDFVSRIPMISRLVSQFGLSVNAVIKPDPNLLADLEATSYNAFYVPEAVGSPYIPAQKDFVIPFGVRSVLGFGGVLAGGDLFAVILFAKVSVPRETSEAAKTLALRVKHALQEARERKLFAA